jgi:hypothetical protein
MREHKVFQAEVPQEVFKKKSFFKFCGVTCKGSIYVGQPCCLIPAPTQWQEGERGPPEGAAAAAEDGAAAVLL